MERKPAYMVRMRAAQYALLHDLARERGSTVTSTLEMLLVDSLERRLRPNTKT